jgi:hypothetical protein
MKTTNAERLGQLADTVDNLIHALQLTVPTDLHLKGIRGNLPDVLHEIQSIYRDETGENPWPKRTEDMTSGELERLHAEFTPHFELPQDFEAFWESLPDEMSTAEMNYLLQKINGWGYKLDKEEVD